MSQSGNFKFSPSQLPWLGRLSVLVFVTGMCMLLCTYASMLACSALFGADYEKLFSDNTYRLEHINAFLLTQVLSVQLGFFLLPAIGFSFLMTKNPLKYLRMQELPKWHSIVLGLILFFFTQIVAIYLIQQVDSWIPANATLLQLQHENDLFEQQLLQIGSWQKFFLIAICIAMLPGIAEELFFRGVILRFIEQGLNRKHWAVWISALLFAGLHMEIRNFAGMLLMGAVLGYVYVWTEKLWIPVVMHAVNNLIPVIQAYASNNSKVADTSADEVSHWVALLSFVFFCLLLFLFYRLYRLNPIAGETQIAK